MKFMNLLRKGLAVLALSIGFTMCGSAVGGDYMMGPYRGGPKKNIEYLIITPAVDRPEMLALLIQGYSRQPVISVPTKEGGQILYYRPNKKTVAKINEADYAKFVAFLNPSKVLIFRGNNLIPGKYLRTISAQLCTFELTCNDWFKNALQLEDMLRISGLYKNYVKLVNEKERNRIYVPADEE
ncbi:MAG: hypothetical protein MST10_05190 [Lentisphaeria bacterium]|nr:hypothetical protein [Lentisphaeria bacterium]